MATTKPAPLPLSASGSLPTLSNTPAEELLRAGRMLAQAQEIDGRAPFVLVPDGYRLEYPKPEELDPLPDHIRRRVTLEDTVSFCAYVKEFRTHTTRIFGTTPDIALLLTGKSGGLAFRAILDYDEAGKDGKASHAAHVVVYPCPLSLEIESWLAQNRKPLPQKEFVEFLESNQADIQTPDSATLMEMILNFEQTSSVQSTSKINRLNGARELDFSETIDATSGSTQGKIKVPEMLALKLPLFEGGREYGMSARLEYRVESGKLKVGYILQTPQRVFREAIMDIRKDIETGTEMPVFTGTAEI